VGAGEPTNEGVNPKGPPNPWQIEFDEIAIVELEKAAFDYEIEREGLGERFLAAVDLIKSKISANPFVYQKKSQVHYHAVIDVFPFTVVYAVSKKHHAVLILNIHHAKRHPRHWRRHKPDWRR
jgi:hypothetical protein